MTRAVIFGCQQIAIGFLDYLHSNGDVEIPLVITSESEGDAALGYGSLRARAESLSIETHDPERAADVIELVAAARPDLVFSIYYRKILPPSLLEIPHLGCINIHPGLLPLYRGPTPTAWALHNGESIFGITIHLMDEGVDTGDILVQHEYDIEPEETGYELHVRAMRLGADVLKENFWKIANRELKPRKQSGPASYYGKLKKKYAIDWQESTERIRNAVRVYARPYSRVETRLGERRLLINRAKVLEADDAYVLQGPGRIADVDPDGALIVSASDGFLRLEEYEIVPEPDAAQREVLLKPGTWLGW